MFIGLAIHNTFYAKRVFFDCFPKTRTWQIISKFDLYLTNWENAFPIQKNRFWLPTVCVTWKTLSWLVGTMLFWGWNISVSNSTKLYPRNDKNAKSNFQHSKRLSNLKSKYLGVKKYIVCLYPIFYLRILLSALPTQDIWVFTSFFLPHISKWCMLFAKQNAQEAYF